MAKQTLSFIKMYMSKHKPVPLCEDMRAEYKHNTVSGASSDPDEKNLENNTKFRHQNVIFPKV